LRDEIHGDRKDCRWIIDFALTLKKNSATEIVGNFFSLAGKEFVGDTNKIRKRF